MTHLILGLYSTWSVSSFKKGFRPFQRMDERHLQRKFKTSSGLLSMFE